MLLGPWVRRSWSPRGHTPVLYQRGRHHKKVSVMAVLCISPARDQVRLYFRLYPNANIQAPHVIGFLRYLDQELQGSWLLVWDRLNAHRAKITAQWIAHPENSPNRFPACLRSRTQSGRVRLGLLENESPGQPRVCRNPTTRPRHSPSGSFLAEKAAPAPLLHPPQPSFVAPYIGHYLYICQ